MYPAMKAVFSIVLAAISLAVTPVNAAAAANWPHWRGPLDCGYSEEPCAFPVKWDTTHGVIWKTPLPGKGFSTPVVWQERIYLTAPVEGQDAALAFDWAGKQLWQTVLGAERAGKHRSGSGCNLSIRAVPYGIAWCPAGGGGALRMLITHHEPATSPATRIALTIFQSSEGRRLGTCTGAFGVSGDIRCYSARVSIFSARSKSSSVRPPSLRVESISFTLFHRRSISGW